MSSFKYDIIADIHGQHEKLLRLLVRLGYRPEGQTYRHDKGRQVIFLGDFIDRGPKILEVLQTVRGMVDHGDALSVIGNHEFNAVCYATENGQGGHLRERSDKNVKQHAATIAAFKNREEWAKWVEWFKRLPFFLDLGTLRAVHACWDPAAIELLKMMSLTDFEFLKLAANKNEKQCASNGEITPYRAIEQCLKGPEVDIHTGFHDTEGEFRYSMRVRWWDLHVGMTFGDACMPAACDNSERFKENDLIKIPQYGKDEPPVFFGHYSMPETAKPSPLRHNIICLDYSAGKEGPLVACRFNGPTQESWEFFEAW